MIFKISILFNKQYSTKCKFFGTFTKRSVMKCSGKDVSEQRLSTVTVKEN